MIINKKEKEGEKMNFSFNSKVTIVGGDGCIKKNAKLFGALGKRALVVTSKSAAKKSGALLDVTNALEQNSMRYDIFDGVTENPLLSVVAEIGRIARESFADYIIGIGGGSVLDAARAATLFAKNDFFEPSEVFEGKYAEALPLVCVGTTAGTGSEVDSISVITDDATGKKMSIKSPLLYAKYAFCDPKYTATMDYRQTVSTALDALCHCLESWFNRAATETSDVFARRGVELIYPNLMRLALDKDAIYNKKFREEMYYGSLWGGLAIDLTGTGFPHPSGYILTEECGIPHGVACALFETGFIRQSVKERPSENERLLLTVGTLDELCDTITALTKNNIRLSKKVCDAIGERLKYANNTKNTLGDFSWEKGKAIAESRFLDRNLIDGYKGRWVL